MDKKQKDKQYFKNFKLKNVNKLYYSYKQIKMKMKKQIKRQKKNKTNKIMKKVKIVYLFRIKI